MNKRDVFWSVFFMFVGAYSLIANLAVRGVGNDPGIFGNPAGVVVAKVLLLVAFPLLFSTTAIAGVRSFKDATPHFGAILAATVVGLIVGYLVPLEIESYLAIGCVVVGGAWAAICTLISINNIGKSK